MKQVLILALFFLIQGILLAQTWTGATSTDWNTATNWSSATVPLSTSSVIIPNSVGSGRWPVLAANTTVKDFLSYAGSQLNVNGFSLIVNGDFDMRGTINNTKAATNIVITVNGGGSNYLRACTFNDTLTFNYNGTTAFFEAYTAGNVYNGSATFNIAGSNVISFCYDNRSSFNSDLTILRTVAGQTNIFNVGCNGVSGNFSYNNNAGGNTELGYGSFLTIINGRINIGANAASGNPGFGISKIKNATAGGTISIKNSGVVVLQNDTLVSNIVVDSFYSANTTDFLQSKFTGTISLSEKSTNSGNVFFRRNEVNGDFTYTHTSADAFYEAYTGGNTYNGNVVIKASGSGLINICYDNRSSFNGNISVTRTVAGLTNIFETGANNISGNFSYVNNAGGASAIGTGGYLTNIVGLINVSANAQSGNPSFEMVKIKNQANGGLITIKNSGVVSISGDTLIANVQIDSFSSANTTDIIRTKFTGNVSLSEKSTNTGGVYFRICEVNGTFTYNHFAKDGFFEAYGGGNIYNGNSYFNCNGSGQFNLCYDNRSNFNGNVSVTRTVAGESNIFFTGASYINGDFSYTNNTAGSTRIGVGNFLTTITGTVNMAANAPSGNPFLFIFKLKNLTAGGNITIENCGQVVMSDDTLKANLNVSGYSAANTSDFLRNDLVGTVTITERSTNTGDTYIRNNNFTGNFISGHNSGSGFYEGYQGGNHYHGNAIFNIGGTGDEFICYDNRSTFLGNFAISRSIAGNTAIFNVGANGVTGNFSYTNNVGGNTHIGVGSFLTVVTGTVSIVAGITSVKPEFSVLKFKNLSGGGNINLANCGQVYLVDDTITVNKLDITGFASASVSDFLRNNITGSFTISEGVSNSADVYFRLNSIKGNFSFTKNSSSGLYEAYNGENSYIGDASFIRNAGSIHLSYNNVSNYYQSLFLNSASNIVVHQQVKFSGGADAVLEQAGTQPIVMSSVIIEKTNGSKLVLNDSLTVSNVTFINGFIVSALGKELIFVNSSTHTGVSDSSHVIGPVIKIGNQAFVFPLGNGQAKQVAAISAPVLITDRFRANYFANNPHPVYDTSKRAAALKSVSGSQYWMIDRLAGNSSVYVTLELGAPRGVAGSSVIADVRVAYWNGAQWNDLGNGATTGSMIDGTVRTAAVVSTFSPFTISSVSLYNPLTNTPAPLSPACANRQLPINFQSSGTFNNGNVFTAQLSDANGSFTSPLNIGSLDTVPAGMNISNVINAYLPSSNIITGTGYKVRVISSNPAYSGTASQSPFTINSLYMGPDTTARLDCINQNISLLPLYNTTGLSATWNTANPSSVNVGTYRLSVLNGIGCTDTAFATVALDVATWIGTSNNNWHDPTNWNTGKIPDNKTHVIIVSGTPNACIISNSNAQAASIQVRPGAVLNVKNTRQLLVVGKCTILPSL